MTHPPIKAPFELPQTEAAAEVAAGGERAIREALAAGPTPGPWHAFITGGMTPSQPPAGGRVVELPLVYQDKTAAWLPADAAYIAACNPEAIAALLAELDGLRAPLSHPAAQAGAVQAVDWLRNNYQNYANIASLCDGMTAALAATQPSAAPGDGQGAVAWRNKADPGSTLRVQPYRPDSPGDWEQTVYAAPGAAIAAREQGASTALSQACNLLSMTIGTLMGAKQKIGYVDRSPIAQLVAEAVEFLRPWPEQMPAADTDWLTNRAQLHEWLADGAKLHPHTINLVVRFARALAEKLAAAEKKYGYSDGWLSPDWMDECRTKLQEHIAKGDPRDVAAYCAFLWHHGESTASPAAAPTSQPNAAAQEQQAGWMPIESAPKGQQVLLYSERDADITIDDWAQYARYNQPNFSRWMPLPPAPTGMGSVGLPSGRGEEA